jgi:hypothetical protein
MKTPFSPFGFPPQFDPSKMDPKVLMQLSELIQQLPPAKINQMQSLMHNMMAGFDVRKEMEEFEKSLPPGFREKLTSIMLSGSSPIETTSTPAAEPASPQSTIVATDSTTAAPPADMDLREARMTILRAVSEGTMSPDEAERLLFS